MVDSFLGGNARRRTVEAQERTHVELKAFRHSNVITTTIQTIGPIPLC